MIQKPGKRSPLPSIPNPPHVISPDSFPIQEFPPHKGGHACSLADEARRVQAGTGAFVSGALGAALAASLLAAPLLLAPGEAWGQFCLGATTASDSDVTCSAATYPVSIRSTIQSNADVTVRVPGGTGTGGTATVITGSTFYAGINLLASDQYQTGDYAIYVGTSAAVSIVDDPGSGNESPGIRIRHLGSGTATVDVSSQVTIGTSTSSRMRAHGIYVRSSGSGGAATITNAGTIYASYEGIDVQHDGAAATTVTHSGTIDSLNDGIQAVTDGAGALMVTSSGGITVTNANQQGIRMRAQKNGAMTLTATGGTITTPGQGIYMESQGTGAVIIQGTTANTGPTITSSASHGIHVRKTGTSATAGDISITTTGGTITPGTGNFYGIYVQDQAVYSGSVTIDNAADITAYRPIYVDRLGAGAVMVTNSGGTVLSATQPGIFAANVASDASDVTVRVRGGTVRSTGRNMPNQNMPAVHARNRGTGDVIAAITGGTLISKHHAGLFAELGDYDASMEITQGGAILGRTGIIAQAAQYSTDDPVVARPAGDQPVIDITWTGTFAAGTTAQTAPNDNGRFAAATTWSQVFAFNQEAAANGASGGVYGGAAGIEAYALSWRDVVAQVAEGDDPGAIDRTAQTTAVPTGATASNNAYVAQLRAVLENGDLVIPSTILTEFDNTATSVSDVSDAEIVTYLRTNAAAIRLVLRDLRREGLSDKEQAVLRAVAAGDAAALDAALDDAAAGFSNAYKTAVRALLNRYNVGNIRVAMTAGSIDSRGDGIRAYYATPHENNGAIDVTVANGAEVTGARAGVWVANAGMGEGNLRKQTVTVNGMVTGSTAGVHIAGGGTVTVGATGWVGNPNGASSGDGVFANGPSDIENRGTITGGEYGIRVLAPSAMTNGGMSRSSHQDGSGVVVTNYGDVKGKVAIQVPAGSMVEHLGGEIRSTDTSDNPIAIRYEGTGGNSMLKVARTASIVGDVHMLSGTVDLRETACPDNINMHVRFTDNSRPDFRTKLETEAHGDCAREIDMEEQEMDDDDNREDPNREDPNREDPNREDPNREDPNRIKLTTPNYSAFALTDDMLSDLTGSIHGAVVETEMRPGTAAAGQVVWATPFGGARDQKGKGTPGVMDATHAFGGGLVGTSWGTRDVRVGGFIGGSVGQIDTQSNVSMQEQTMDMQTIFGGVYASHARGTVLYDARMLVGQMTHDLTRRVSSRETAESEYSSLLLSPEVGVATTLHVTDTLDVRPRLRLRYAGLFTQGFRERAERADRWDVQYEKRTMHLVEGRAEVGVPVTLANGGQINPRVGVEGRWLLSGSKIKARSLNRDISHDRDAGGDDGVLTGTLGVGMSVPVADSMALVGSFDGALTTEDAWRATGYLGLTYSF